LCFHDSGERSFYNSKHPIYTPSDLKGLKLRVVNSDLFVSMVRNLGADATPMPLSEVYSSLVQGVIDGAENNPPSYETGRHFEAAPYLSLTRHVVAPEVLVMSKVRWDKLTKADQALVRETARESVTYMRTLWDARVDGAMARLVKAGVKVNQIDDLEAFRIRVQPVWKQFIRTPQLQRMVHAIEALSESAPESKVAK
ncbi:MAG: TRAP transporter substrate-binding protein DctP, partial [Asticcacaulis sp.]